MPRTIRFIVCFFLVLNSLGLHAQNKKILDSILKAATLQVYEHPDQAIKTGNHVAAHATDLKTKTNALMLVSDAYSSKRDYQKSLQYVIKAKNLASKSDNVVIQMKILTKIAIQYQQLKIYDKAIQYLDESNALAKNYPEKDSILLLSGNNYIIRGFIYKEQLNCDIAIGYFKQAIETYRGTKSALVNANLSIATYNLGNCYIRLYDNQSAKKSFEQSIVYATKVGASSLLAFAQKGLAEVYTLEGNYNGALKMLLEAAKISNGVGDLVLNRGIYKGLSENYLAIDDWKNYQKFHQKYLETILKIKESERKSVSDSLNETAAIQNSKVSAAKRAYFSGIVLFSILSGTIILLLVFMQKKAVKKLQHLQNEIQNP